MINGSELYKIISESITRLRVSLDDEIVNSTAFKFAAKLARGFFAPDLILFNKFGVNLEVDISSSPEDCWSVGGLKVYLNNARTISCVSTSAGDTQSLQIEGLDANWDLQTITIVLNGTTPVVTTETFIRINRMSIVGSVTNLGTVTATALVDLVLQSQIEPIAGQTSDASFSTPAGYTGYITKAEINVFLESGTNQKNAIIECKQRPFGESFRNWYHTGLGNRGGSLMINREKEPFYFEEKTDIRFALTAANNNTSVSIAYAITLEKIA